MSREATRQECCQAVSELLPELPVPERKALAALVCGVVHAESARLSRASAAVPGEAQDRSKQRRAQRLVANERLDIPRAQRRLLARVLQGRRGRVDLLLDATTNGATAQQAGTVTLLWERLGCIDDAAVGASRCKRGPTWVSDWDAALPTNVVALPGPNDDDPWLLITDLPASPARCREYRRRTQEEELFRDLKSFGWQWQSSRLRRPDRVDRLLLVLALATRWIDALAHQLLRHRLRHLLEDRSRPCYSYFQLGLRWLRRCLALDLPLPCTLKLLPIAGAAGKLS